MLQLSPFVLPQVRMGALRLTTLNMSAHPERVAYVEGLQTHLELLVRLAKGGAIPRVAVDDFHDRAHLGKMVASIDWDAPGGPQVIRWVHAADFVSFDRDRLGVMFMDGRLRDEHAMLYVPTGTATPAFATLISTMARGATTGQLLEVAAANEIEIDYDFLGLLVERGVLDEIADPAARIPERFAAPGDRVTWLGETGIVFQSGPTTVWFDPLVPARIRYRDDELATAFAPQLANALYTPPPYDRECEQLTVVDLPRPDAVVISHEDVDIFDLGVLMCLPQSVPIVVPAAQPGRPWQVDMAETIADVLGERRVIRLAHGETIAFGDVRITATPHVGEWPKALPTDWNCHVVHGREGTVVLTHCASVIAEHAELIAQSLGDRGGRAVLFGLDLFVGDNPCMGFREAPDVLHAPTRPWPWFLQIDQIFEPNPPPGVNADVLRALGERTGLRRYFPYGAGGAPWLTFQVPHVHRYYISNRPRVGHDRQVETAKSINFEVPQIQIGVPFVL